MVALLLLSILQGKQNRHGGISLIAKIDATDQRSAINLQLA